jgi:hypothetical protein
MKAQIDRTIKARLVRGAFYLIPLLAMCVIPFALAQRDTTGRNFIKRVSPSVASAPESQSPALSSWSIVANYPEILESPAVSSDGTFAYSAGGGMNFVPTNGFYRYDPIANAWATLASLPQALFDARAAYAANVNKIYVFGGIDAGFNVLNTTYMTLMERSTLSAASIATLSKPVKLGSMIRLLTHGMHPARAFRWRWEAAPPALLTKTFIWQVLLAPGGQHSITVTTS